MDPLPLTLANLLLGPGFRARRAPDRAFDRLLDAAGSTEDDERFTDGFRHLLRCWAAAEHLTPVGWLSARGHVGRHLANRARIRRLLAAHPEIEREPVERPVFVVGLPRTATTLTHGILSLSADHRCPLLWELLTPDLELPPRETEQAITAARRLVGGINLFSPRFRHIHNLRAEGPEECTFALPHTVMPLSQAEIPEYLPWHETHDFGADYRYLKQIYQVLQHGRPRRRWVLKSPLHLENLDALRAVFPDATIVWTHRDPATAVASFCSLVEHGMAVNTRPLDLHWIGATWLELLARSAARGLASRAKIPRESLVDVPYSWLGSDPAAGAPKLYAAVGAAWTEADAARLPAAVARPRGSRVHSYDLARYGLGRADVDAAFAEYNALRAEVDRA
ncbi:sulfotransferase family protein [Streptomyces fuscichromogenes]|uniref:sulfotransferase family protein n=1 Tax=Streptomyces fuscichromogenes TaxID=1324013 RepID=UPI003817D8CA